MADRFEKESSAERLPDQASQLNDERLPEKTAFKTPPTANTQETEAKLPKVEIQAQPESSKRKLDENGEYKVNEGDMLSYIAKDFLGPGASTREIYNFVNKIAKDNNLKDADFIQPDQKLKINLPGTADVQSAQVKSASTEVAAASAEVQPSTKNQPLTKTEPLEPATTANDKNPQVEIKQPQAEPDSQASANLPESTGNSQHVQEPSVKLETPTEQPASIADQQPKEPNSEAAPSPENKTATDVAKTETAPNIETVETGDTLDKLGHVTGLALEGAKDHIVEHPVLVAAETVGGIIVGGALVATAPAWVTAGVAIGGLSYLGYKLYDKSKEVLPALDTVFQDNPDAAQYRHSEQVLKEDLGTGLVDGAMIVAGGVGAKVIANKISAKAASATAASAEEAEQAVVEEAAKQVPKPQPDKTLPGKQGQNTENVNGKQTQDTGTDNSPKPGDSKVENATDKGTAAIVQKNGNAATADEWAGTKYKNPDGTFRQEDSHFVSADGRVAVVADGVGGNGAGNVASRITTDVFSARMQHLPENASDDQVAVWLKQTIEEAAQTMKQAQLNGSYVAPDGSVIATNGKMASTVVATVRNENKMLVAWAGDSRAYRLRGGKLEQLTKDHSWENEVVDKNIMTMEEAKAQDKGHIILSALGSKLKIDQVTVDIAKGDRFLLASDGLETLSSPEIESIMNAKEATGEVASRLLKKVKAKQALSNEPQDNTTVIVLDPKAAVELPKPVPANPKPTNLGRKSMIVMPGVVPSDDVLREYLEVPPLTI